MKNYFLFVLMVFTLVSCSKSKSSDDLIGEWDYIRDLSMASISAAGSPFSGTISFNSDNTGEGLEGLSSFNFEWTLDSEEEILTISIVENFPFTSPAFMPEIANYTITCEEDDHFILEENDVVITVTR